LQLYIIKVSTSAPAFFPPHQVSQNQPSSNFTDKLHKFPPSIQIQNQLLTLSTTMQVISILALALSTVAVLATPSPSKYRLDKVAVRLAEGMPIPRDMAIRTPAERAEAMSGKERRSDNCGCAAGNPLTCCCEDCEDGGVEWYCSDTCWVLAESGMCDGTCCKWNEFTCQKTTIGNVL